MVGLVHGLLEIYLKANSIDSQKEIIHRRCEGQPMHFGHSIAFLSNKWHLYCSVGRRNSGRCSYGRFLDSLFLEILMSGRSGCSKRKSSLRINKCDTERGCYWILRRCINVAIWSKIPEGEEMGGRFSYSLLNPILLRTRIASSQNWASCIIHVLDFCIICMSMYWNEKGA